ncbi:hypothetical protein BY458DRAFT_552197 [Sporodiniella umbellata]|nr:hypothetical protein BY458DRAFT_552197 [Sporodiniella umbellata]
MTSIQIFLNQDVVPLDGFRPNSISQITGFIELYSKSVPTWSIQLQLLGEEQTSKETRVILDDTFHLPKADWTISGEKCRLPFTVPVPNNIPISFQNKEAGIHYRVLAHSLLETAVQSVHFYKSYAVIPRRVFWGIAKESSSKWQYEFEFPSAFDLSCTNDLGLSVRLRSNSNTHAYCLVTCQIVQSVRYKNCENQQHVLMTTSELLGAPNATWSEPCSIEFELDHPMLLPSVKSQSVSVEHSIWISCVFSSSQEPDYTMNFQFPLDVTGVLLPLLACTSTCSSSSSISSANSCNINLNIEESLKQKPVKPALKSFFSFLNF